MAAQFQHQPADGLFKKTKMCKFKRNNMCTRGAACTYAHSDAELQSLPNLFKTKMCFEMSKTRQCPNPNCPYAHSKVELRNVAYENSKANANIELEDTERVEPPEFSNAVYFGMKPCFWYPSLMNTDSPWVEGDAPWTGSMHAPTKSTPVVSAPASPCSTYAPISPASPAPSIEDSDSWLGSPAFSPSRQITEEKDGCSVDSRSELSESEFQSPKAVKWMVKNTFLELTLSEEEKVEEPFESRRLFRCSSSPVYI
jgi:hypothetical protein